MLIKELVNIQKQLPPSILLRIFGTIITSSQLVTLPMMTKILILIKLPLIDHDSSLDLCRVYNLPVFNPPLNKALTYQLETNTLAVSRDGKYATIPTKSLVTAPV